MSPRIRDFRGFSPKGFDGNGNYNFGINEQVIFPEINYDKITKTFTKNINLTCGRASSSLIECDLLG